MSDLIDLRESVWRLPIPSGRCYITVHTFRLQVLALLGDPNALRLLNEFQAQEVEDARAR